MASLNNLNVSRINLFIFGGHGYIGKNLVRKIENQHHDWLITIIDRNNFKKFVHEAPLAQFILIFLGGESPRKITGNHEMKFLNGIIRPTLELVNAYSRSRNCLGIIYISSILPNYSISTLITNEWNVDSTYHKSRLIQNLIFSLIDTDFPIISFRLSNIYGGDEDWSTPTKLKKYLLEKGELDISDSTAIRDWLHVDDGSNLIIKAISKILVTKLQGHMIFDVGYGVAYSVDDLLQKFDLKKMEKLNSTVKIRQVRVDNTNAINYFNWNPQIDIVEWLKSPKKIM